jgi:hypothetical protein
VFPLRPGETQFEISYHLPYSGQAKIEPKPLAAQQHFVIMLPKEMQFQADNAARFQTMPDNSGAHVEVATQVEVGEPLGFTVSGTGVLASSDEGQGGGGGQMGGASATADNRPGGGLGPPTDSPDPLHQWRWYILGGFVAMLGFGAIYMVTRQGAVPAAARTSATSSGPGNASPKVPVRRAAAVSAPPIGAGAAPATAAAASPAKDRTGMLLEGLKEELFELEVERQQGTISVAEYEKAKAALDQTLHRALTRKKQ